MSSAPQHCDVMVIGAGAVGAVAALALRSQGHQVTVLDAGRPVDSPQGAQVDARVFALSPASIDLLESLGLWNDVATRAQPYAGMTVSDAVSGSDIRFRAAEFGLRSLGAIVENSALVSAAQAALANIAFGHAVTAVSEQTDAVAVTTDSGAQWLAKTLILADGAGSPGRQALGIPVAGRDYGGQAIVCHLACEHGHDVTAWQRFLPTGPVALLPLSDGRVSLVWSTEAAQAQRLLAMDDEPFAHAVTEATGGRLGRLYAPTRRFAFALRRQTAARFTTNRCVLLGDAAHVVHPLAGQGVNLGFDDVRALRVAMSDPATGLRPVARRRYERERRAEIARMSQGIDGLDRLFATANPVVSTARGIGLHLADVLPPLKRQFAEAALGVKPGFAAPPG